MSLKIAAVIPTLNEGETLAAALEALLGGSERPDEILVVDGGSRDGTREVARRYPVTVLDNPKVHAAAARNVGLHHSQADVLAFTDADCRVAPTWVARLRARFAADTALDGLGGRLIPRTGANEIEAFSAKVFIHEVMCFSGSGHPVTRRQLRDGLITANCAYRRAALLRVGGFRDAFSNYGEDLDLMWRLLDSSRLAYDPELVVTHQFPNTRRRLIRKYIQYGIASSLLTRHHSRSPQIDWHLYRKLLANVRGAFWPGSSAHPHRLYVLQLGAHLTGKWLGSVRYRAINL
ncbi:MAG TPA: glycosyltransferase [Anaerolineae bacterium]|nr:glycosyltransferase [Anaerolineae bacterium]HOR00361.1 glycosyltransferase [Anaerolineae bacterium]HPL28233.1 glycosyltransferase [Anaerolineae bacterium]